MAEGENTSMRFRTTIPLEIAPEPSGDGPKQEILGAVAAEPRSGSHPVVTGPRLVWFGIAAVVIALSVVLAAVTTAAAATPYRAALFTSTIAVGVFAVSLSFVIFQLAPYRSLIPGASTRHLAGAGVLLALSVSSAIGLAFSDNASAHVSIAALPVLVFSSFILVRLAQREAVPEVILNRHVNRPAVRRHGFSLVIPLRAREAELEAIARPSRPGQKPLPPPMHEIFHQLLPPARSDDPLELVVGLATAAVMRGDTFTYSLAARRAFEALAWTRELPICERDGKADYKVRTGLVSNAQRMVDRVGQASLRDEHSTEFAEEFINAALQLVVDGVIGDRQGDSDVIDAWGDAVTVAAKLIDRGHGVRSVLVIGRLAAEHGMLKIKTGHEMDALSAYPAQIHGLGHRAIQKGDTDFLYRCLEAVAWIGCAAVREDDEGVCDTCLEALAQLGREARAADLKCFWRRCLLTPFDHVDERIGWIASWLHVVSEPKRHRWCRHVAQAYSRLHGHEYTVEVVEEGDENRVELRHDPDKPHVETIDDHGRLGRVDYSDPSALKDLDLI